jgi:hypothetical protein
VLEDDPNTGMCTCATHCPESGYHDAGCCSNPCRCWCHEPRCEHGTAHQYIGKRCGCEVRDRKGDRK